MGAANANPVGSRAGRGASGAHPLSRRTHTKGGRGAGLGAGAAFFFPGRGEAVCRRELERRAVPAVPGKARARAPSAKMVAALRSPFSARGSSDDAIPCAPPWPSLSSAGALKFRAQHSLIFLNIFLKIFF